MMTLVDYTLIVLSLIFFKTVSQCMLFYFGNISRLYPETDLFGKASEEHLQQLDMHFGNRWMPPIYLSTFLLIAWPLMRWDVLDHSGSLRTFVMLNCTVLAWKAISLAADPVTGKNLLEPKCVLLLLLWGVYYYPGFIPFFLFVAVHFLRSWFVHQAMLVRVLQMCMAYFIAAVFLQVALVWVPEVKFKGNLAAPLFLVLCVIASHYVVMGIAKLKVGKHWHSWMLENKRHYVAVAAYMWGWKRVRPFQEKIPEIQSLASRDRFSQILLVCYELGWIFILVDLYFAVAWLLISFFYHINAFKVTGNFFWQSLLVNAITSACIIQAPFSLYHALFNMTNGLLAAAIILLFPNRRCIWDPQRAAGWDSPFVGRVQWKIIGRSGKAYGLYNDFISNHERFFGGTYPNFLVPHKLFHKYLGKVASKGIRNAVIGTQGEPEKIEALQEKVGVQEKNQMLEQEHDEYLVAFFKKYNSKRYRQSLLSIFRAPSEQYFFGGPLPAFRAQEKVAQVIVTYREEFFNGKDIVLVRDEVIKELAIPMKAFVLEKTTIKSTHK